MTKKQKKMLKRIILATVLMVLLHFVPAQGLLRFGLYMIPYLIIGHDILRKAFKGICNGQVFDENFLMASATVGALIIGLTQSGDYVEAVAVMLFFQIGELFENYAVGKSRRSMAGQPCRRKCGKVCRVKPESFAGGLLKCQPLAICLLFTTSG